MNTACEGISLAGLIVFSDDGKVGQYTGKGVFTIAD